LLPCSPAPLLFFWLLITALLLGGVYYVDRGGWNWFLISGYDVTQAEDFSAAVDLPSADFVTQYPIFVRDPQEPDKLVLPRGEYIIRETIVVPRGTVLTIEPGTVLRFGAGRSLISYSPIIARGTESEPIRFTAQNKWLKWGAVGLVRAGQAVFEHVRFDHGRRALVNGLDFFGALSLIETDVEIRHSQFVDLFGKDGVNVRYGRVLIQDNLFRNTYKDGLDLDGGSGEISHNRFINCDDEGIDLSENYEVQVFENTILDRRGGRMAAENNLEALMALNTLGYSDRANQR
jgi:hypothetical protein